MKDSLILTKGLKSGIQISDQTDLNVVSSRCFTERWSLRKGKVKIGMTIQVVANSLAGNQPRGYVINSVVTDIKLLPALAKEKRRRYRVYFDPALPIDTGARDIKFSQQPVRYF